MNQVMIDNKQLTMTTTEQNINIKVWVYQMSWYESKRHTKSHTDMYYLKAEHTHWAEERGDTNCKIHYICVPVNSPYHRMAEECSQIRDNQELKARSPALFASFARSDARRRNEILK